MKEGYKLKQGDLVVMHTCMEHDSPDNFGKIWTCRSDEFKHKGHDYGSIFLDGFSGSFSTEFLQRVNVNELLAEKDTAIKELRRSLIKFQELSLHNHTLAAKYEQESFGLRKALKEAKQNEIMLKDTIDRALIAYRTQENSEETMMYMLEDVLCGIYPSATGQSHE